MLPKFCTELFAYVNNNSSPVIATLVTPLPAVPVGPVPPVEPAGPVAPAAPVGPVAPKPLRSNVVPSYAKLLPANVIVGLLVKSLYSPLVATVLNELVAAFNAMLSVIVVLKLASSPNAAANSFSVSNVPGALSVIAATIVAWLAKPCAVK